MKLSQKVEVLVITDEVSPDLKMPISNIKVIQIPKIKVKHLYGLVKVMLFSLVALLHFQDYDLIYLRTFSPPELAASYVGKLLGRPLIYRVTGVVFFEPLTLKNRLFQLLFRLVISRADVVVPYSRLMLSGLKRIHVKVKRIVVLPNAIDINRFTYNEELGRKVRQMMGLEKAPLILYVGRISPAKGIQHLLKAFALVKTRLPEARLLIIGPFPHLTFLEKLRWEACRLQIKEAVIFLGPVPNANLPAYLSATKINGVFCLPSLHEGVPRCLLEAMAIGLPVVATKVGGVPDIIVHNCTGVLVPPKDYKAMADSLLEILTHPEKAYKLGREAALSVRANYTWEATLKGLIDLFKEVSQRR